jgi:membrane carboxypeptidase/penicillin-binding protein
MRAKQPHIIENIANSKKGSSSGAAESEAISPEAAWQVTEGLQDALRTGVGPIAFSEFGEGHACGRKTGTAYNFTDTCAFSDSTACLWVGFDHLTRIYRSAFGKDLALPIWTKIMNVAADEFPAVKFRGRIPKARRDLQAHWTLATPRRPRCRWRGTRNIHGVRHGGTGSENSL